MSPLSIEAVEKPSSFQYMALRVCQLLEAEGWGGKGDGGVVAQSRQSAKRFSSRWNWDSPTPLAAGECAPPPFGPGGRAHSLKGWGSPNSNEGTYTVVLYIYKYFVGGSVTVYVRDCTLQLIYKQGVTKRYRLSLLTNCALVYEPKCGGLRGLSQWLQLCT